MDDDSIEELIEDGHLFPPVVAHGFILNDIDDLREIANENNQYFHWFPDIVHPISMVPISTQWYETDLNEPISINCSFRVLLNLLI